MTSKSERKLAGWRLRLCVTAMLGCAAVMAHAKNVDYTPAIASSDYWDSHHIAVVQAISTGGQIDEDGQPESVTYQVETRISDEDIEAIRTVPFSDLWFGGDEVKPNPIAAGDRFAIYYDREEPAQIAVIPLPAGAAGAQIAATLRSISVLRKNGGAQAYLDAVLAADPMVARYSLRYLLAQTGWLKANEDYMAKLLRIRDDLLRETGDRILAGRLANRLERTSDTPDAEYTRLEASLTGSQNEQWTSLKPLVDRLLEFTDKRPDTVAFLIQLATTSTVAQPIRIVAYGAFVDPRLFHFDAPDAESGLIYQACLQMLSDQDPTMRRAGAALVYNITMTVNLANRPRYMQQSKKALGAALSAETDETAKFHLSYFLQLLSS
jgi:hypothetical protein